MPTVRLEIETRPGLRDALGVASSRRLREYLGLEAAVRTRRVYLLDLEVSADEAAAILEVLVDPIAEVGALGMLPDDVGEGIWHCSVGLRPGVTDSVGRSARRAAEDRLGRALAGEVYTATTYILRAAAGPPLTRDQALRAAAEALHNPLIEQVTITSPPRRLDLTVPRAGSARSPRTESVPLRDASAAELLRISQGGVLALSLAEMEVIQRYWQGRGRDPTDAELECLAQTWSEHCKHKIFASPIDYIDPEGRRSRIDRGLFRTYIRGATEAVAAARAAADVDPEGEPFLVSVFHDNAGVVRFTARDHLVYKVETHNSPSALDPYGGAMTGIVGVNRDTLGTGLGADNLTNVWGYCFGEPSHQGELPPGLMHPRRIRDGVHHGVIDGGNQSGIPYSRGFELFDRRFLGKPLVYCGTVAVMPTTTADGRPGERKEIAAGDLVVMVGGRIGKDGIHGATFSSGELAEDSPMAAVQIGDPITQKMMADMLAEARDLGLYSGITDNGAGGLSSSVGEMAQATGGAEIDLARAPLKYPGLAPWEILISEAQERMTVAVPPAKIDAFLALAARREVEATVLGVFTESGRLIVRHGDEAVCDLDLAFLHEGVPLPTLPARWEPRPRELSDPAVVVTCPEDQLGEVLLELIGRPNLASSEAKARSYDHEVKGLSVIKPFVGVREDVPATATVMRVRHDRPEGIVLGEGIHPFYSDVDAMAMATAAVDEGVRRVVCAGARLDRLAALDNFCWPDPVESDKTPDGAHKLAQLVRACEGLRAACEAFGVPLISGKDSMKNDANLGGIKISIPPTLLVSVLGQLEDVSRALDLTPLRDGDLVAVIGPVADELGESELARARGWIFESVPRTDLEASAARLRAFAAARDRGLVRSAHVVGRGGLAVALAHMTIAGELGLDLEIEAMCAGLPSLTALFAESTGRIVITAPASARAELEAALGEHGLVVLGAVRPGRSGGGWLRITRDGRGLVDVDAAALRTRFQGGLDHGS